MGVESMVLEAVRAAPQSHRELVSTTGLKPAVLRQVLTALQAAGQLGASGSPGFRLAPRTMLRLALGMGT